MNNYYKTSKDNQIIDLIIKRIKKDFKNYNTTNLNELINKT